LANSSITLQAGEQTISKIDNSSVSGYNLTVLFSYGDVSLVTFAGAGFDLYISKDYYSSISPDDILYASGFSVNDLSHAYPIDRDIANPILKDGGALFRLGTANLYDGSRGSNVSCKILVGPIPADISADYMYVKIYDGSLQQVGVSQIIEILPSLMLDPTSGSAGTPVTINGVGLPSNKTLDLHYAFPLSSLIAQVATDANGRLNYSWEIFDLANDFTTTPSQPIVISVNDAGTNASIGNFTFTENSRVFTLIDGESNATSAGNGTALVDVRALGSLRVAGANFYPGSAALSIDGDSLGAATVDASSTFDATFTLPQLTIGIHNVTVANNGIVYTFRIRTLPTLIGDPESGPPGSLLRLEAYSFEPDRPYYIYWYGLTSGDATWYNLVNCTTDSLGRFSANLTVPSASGGPHAIAATSAFSGQNSSSISIYAHASFAMNPPSTVYITFQQSGVGADFTGSLLSVDSATYSRGQLPLVTTLTEWTAHSFSWSSPLVVNEGKRYVWSASSGLSAEQAGTFIATTDSLSAAYTTQYYVTFTNATGGTLNGQSGWYDSSSTISIVAVPSAGYFASGWNMSGGIQFVSGSAETMVIRVTGPGTVSPVFGVIDQEPPSITAIVPTNGSTTASANVTISAYYSDNVAVNLSSVVLRVDGTDVTPSATVGTTGVTYGASFAAGIHNVELTVSDTSGNPRTAAWTFSVQQQPSGGYPTEYIIAIVLVVAAIAVVAFLAMRRGK